MKTDRLMALSCRHCQNFYLLLLSESIYHLYSIAYKHSENFWQIVPYTWGKLKPNKAFEPPPETTARTIEFRGVLLPDFTQAPGLTRRISVQKVLYTVLCCKRWHPQKAAINTEFCSLTAADPWKQKHSLDWALGSYSREEPWGERRWPRCRAVWVSFAMELLQDEPFFSSC